MSKFLPSGSEAVAGVIVFMLGAAAWEIFGRDLALRVKASLS